MLEYNYVKNLKNLIFTLRALFIFNCPFNNPQEKYVHGMGKGKEVSRAKVNISIREDGERVMLQKPFWQV